MSEQVLSKDLIAKQLEQIQLLSSLLAKENEVLQQHSPDALIEITTQKNELLLAIQQLDQHLALHQEFQKSKNEGQHQDVIDKIADSLEQCKKQNIINGQIIQHSQLAVEKMKTSLLESHSKSSMTYDSTGKKSGGLSSIGIKA
jgi:flagella synthesis protein FlgN